MSCSWLSMTTGVVKIRTSVKLEYRLSANFIWWPLSPIGFIIAGVWHTNHAIWANAFIAWLLTTLIRKFGGFRLYRGLRPAFLGLVFGHYLTDAAMALFAALVLGSRGVTALQ